MDVEFAYVEFPLKSMVQALTMNKREAISLLLDAGAPIRPPEIQAAAFAGHEGLVELYLSKGLSRENHVEVMNFFHHYEMKRNVNVMRCDVVCHR